MNFTKTRHPKTARTRLLLLLLRQPAITQKGLLLQIHDNPRFTEIFFTREDQPEDLPLQIQIFSADKKYWFNFQDLSLAISVSHTEEPTLLALLRNLQLHLQILAKNPKVLARLKRYFNYEQKPGKFLERNRLDPDQWQKVNLAAFTMLKILQEEPRLGKVTRIVAGQRQQWSSMIQGELYPWLGISGELANRETILQYWRGYAADFPQHKMPLSLYIHIPFCAHRCNFCHCSLTLFENRRQTNAYVEQLLEEIRIFAATVYPIPLITLFIGGGTPSMLTPEELSKIATAIQQNFNIQAELQFTFEANPDSLTEEKIAAVCRVLQINRLALGLQTLDATAQQHANRFNKDEKIIKLLQAAKANQIEVVNLDLIIGLDGLSYQGFKRDLKHVRRLNPEIIKLYEFRPFQFQGGEVKKIVIDRDQASMRKKQNMWADKFLRRVGHGGLLMTSDKKEWQKNLQTTLYENNAGALMSLGVSGISYIPQRLFYESPLDTPGYSADFNNYQYRLYESDEVEDFHSYLAKNIQSGLNIHFIKEKYKIDLIQYQNLDLELLRKIGVIVRENTLYLDPYSHTNLILLKSLFISKKLQSIFNKRWQDQYDPEYNYYNQILKIYDGEEP